MLLTDDIGKALRAPLPVEDLDLACHG